MEQTCLVWVTCESVGRVGFMRHCHRFVAEGQCCENPVNVQVMAACGIGQHPGPYTYLGHKIVSCPTLSANILQDRGRNVLVKDWCGRTAPVKGCLSNLPGHGVWSQNVISCQEMKCYHTLVNTLVNEGQSWVNAVKG